jgi:hypothetical protein
MLFTLLLRASLAVVVGIFSFVVKLMQVARLRFRHKTCGRKEQVYVPFTQSRNLLVVVWLGDMTFKLKRCYRTFEFKSHVGYSRTLEDIVISYGDLLPREFIEEFNQDLPKEFEEIFSSINIYLIETQRLIEDIRRPSINNRINRPNVRQKTMVENYSEDIIDQIQSRLRESGSLSASLDRKFPGKLLSTIKIPDEATESQIRILYKEQSEFRTRLMNSGLIEQEESVSLPSGKLDGPEIKVLWLYLNDVDTKLAVFNNLLKKTELLMKIINSRFTYKKFKIDKEKGFIFFSEKTKTEIKPNSLSSGEQHELVLAYSLIFKVSENSVVFIDEPELSLHINWQNKFLDDIDEISKITNLDFVIATHSPAIINKRRNLMVGIPTTVG